MIDFFEEPMKIMNEEEWKEHERKMRAKTAVDTILAAEQFKKDKEIKKHISAELKERAKVLDSAMQTKKDSEPKKAPTKKRK